MKSLYESILSSTHAGKTSIIKAWLDENNIKNYTINDKGEVDVDGDVHLSGLGLTEFPSFIQFGTVKWNFFCNNNNLTTLKGAPKKVGLGFYCSFNNLTTLEGAPKEVGWDFNCSDNNLTSLKGAPRKAWCFNCVKNTTKFTEEDVRKVCKVEKKIYV